MFTQFSLFGCNTLLSNTMSIVSPKCLLWFTSILVAYNWGSVKVRFRQATWPWNNDIRWSGHKWHKEQSQIQKWISDRDKKWKNKWFQNEWFCNSDHYCQMPPENFHENLACSTTNLPFLSSNPKILKAFLKTFPTKMKPTKCPTKEKKNETRKTKNNGRGEEAKSNVEIWN